MANEIQGIDYETALANLRASSLELRGDLPEKNELLSQFHPDYQANARVKLPIGPNTGDYCHPDLAKLLISHPLIDDYDLSGAEHLNTDVLVIGGGGAGAAAALSATEAGARVIINYGEQAAYRRQQYRHGRRRHSGCCRRGRQLAAAL